MKNIYIRGIMIKTLNENLRELRVARGINQSELGQLLGVTKQCVSNWENDNVLPSIEMLVKIADYFNVSCDYLLGRTSTKILNVSDLNTEQITIISSIIKEFEKSKH